MSLKPRRRTLINGTFPSDAVYNSRRLRRFRGDTLYTVPARLPVPRIYYVQSLRFFRSAIYFTTVSTRLTRARTLRVLLS